MTGDRATLLALELIRRQLGGLPGEFVRAWMDAEAAQTAPADAAPKPKTPTLINARIEGFDANAANAANRLAAQGWPKVIQLVNSLLGMISRQASLNSADAGGARGLGAASRPKALPAASTAAAKEQEAYLDRVADFLKRLRTAVGSRTSELLGKATGVAGRIGQRVSAAGGRLAGRAGAAWQNSRVGKAYLREWRSRTARGMRAGAGRMGAAAMRGAKAAGGRLAGGAKAAGGAMAGALTAVISPFALKLLAVLGPMALLAATLSSASSGFQLVTSSVKLLASTLAPVLMPFMFMLAAGLATLSDVVWAQLAPNLTSWYTLIIREAVPAVTAFIEALKLIGEVAAESTETGGRFLDDPLGESWDAMKRTGGAVWDWLNEPMFDLREPPAAADIMQATEYTGETWSGAEAQRRMRESAEANPTAGVAPEAPAAAPGGSMGDFLANMATTAATASGAAANDPGTLLRRNMQDTLKELQMSVGPKASYQGLAQASKSAQLAALNQSPFEAKMLQRMQEVIAAMTRVVDNTTKPIVGRHSGD